MSNVQSHCAGRGAASAFDVFNADHLQKGVIIHALRVLRQILKNTILDGHSFFSPSLQIGSRFPLIENPQSSIFLIFMMVVSQAFSCCSTRVSSSPTASVETRFDFRNFFSAASSPARLRRAVR